MDSSGPPTEDYGDENVDMEPPPAPPPEGPEEAPGAPPEEGDGLSLDRLWEDEDYEELIPPEEPPAPRPAKRPRRGRGLAIFSAVLVILALWTLLSPSVLGPVGTEYVLSSPYASLGNYTGARDLWAGKTVWGVSICKISNTPGNTSMDLGVLVTKVSESPSNWFFRGSAISLKEASAYDEDGTLLGTMANRTDLGFGVLAYLPVAFPGPGEYLVYVKVRFAVSEVMRMGFFPMETVQAEKVWIDEPITVSVA